MSLLGFKGSGTRAATIGFRPSGAIDDGNSGILPDARISSDRLMTSITQS